MKTKTYGEQIGKKIRVKEAKNKSLSGKTGKVIDETKNTITIIENKNKKILLKNQIQTEEI